MRQKSLWIYGGLAVLICLTTGLRAEELVVSETLRKAAEKLFAEEYDEDLKAKKLQPETKKEDLVKSAIEMLSPLLKVTPAQEEKFKKGEFDDEANKKTIEAQIVIFKTFKETGSKQTIYFMAQYEAGKLKGCALELTVRLNEMMISQIKGLQKELEKIEKEKAKAKEAAQ